MHNSHLLDFKRIVSAAAIDDDALAAEKNERNPTPQGNATKTLAHIGQAVCG